MVLPGMKAGPKDGPCSQDEESFNEYFPNYWIFSGAFADARNTQTFWDWSYVGKCYSNIKRKEQSFREPVTIQRNHLRGREIKTKFWFVYSPNAKRRARNIGMREGLNHVNLTLSVCFIRKLELGTRAGTQTAKGHKYTLTLDQTHLPR